MLTINTVYLENLEITIINLSIKINHGKALASRTNHAIQTSLIRLSHLVLCTAVVSTKSDQITLVEVCNSNIRCKSMVAVHNW